MPPHKNHGKHGHKFKELKCKSGHPGCKPGNFLSFGPCDDHGRIKWEVLWYPCRKDEAIAYMQRKHGFIYHPAPGKDREKSKHHKSHEQKLGAVQENQHQQQFPTKSKYMTPVNQGHIRESMGGHIDSNQGMNSGQGMVSPQGTRAAGAQNMAVAPEMPPPHHRSKHRPKPEQDPWPSAMVSPDASAGPTRPPAVLPAPVIYPPQAPPDGQRHGRRRHKSTRDHEPQLEHHPQEYPTMSPGGTVVLPKGMSMPVPPPMPSDQGSMDGQQHQSHRLGLSGHSNHEQTPLSPADMHSPPTMRECMAIMAEEAMSAPAEEPQARGIAIAPRMSNMPPPMNPVMSAPPTRNMPMRQGPQQGPQQAPGMSPAPPTPGMSIPPPIMSVTPTQNTALSPAGQAASGMSGPPNMRLPMRGASQAEGMVTAPGMTSMPPPTMPTMTARSTTQNVAPLPAPQPGPGMSPAPPAAGMYGPPRTQLSLMGAPQTGAITTSAGPSGPPPQDLPLRQPKPQPTNPRMLRGAGPAGTPGTPGAQAMALRSPPGALSTAPGMPPNPSMQPPPRSMPPFPGTGPGTPASMELAAAPPPPVPTPPLYPGALD